MSFLGRGSRRGRRLTALAAGGALAAFQALALIGAPAASATVATCSFGSGVLTVNLTSGTSSAFSADAATGNILIDGTDTFAHACAAIPAVKATLTNTTEIDVNGDAGNETVVIDLLVKWGTINWKIDLKTGTSDTVIVDGHLAPATTALDSVVGASGLDLTDDGDLDATVTGVDLIELVGGLGDDFLSGAGSTITGGPTTIPMTVLGGPGGYDDLSGGLGNDTLVASVDGAAADYLSFAGPITADLTAGTVTGAGSDTLVGIDDIYGSQGNDTITGNANDNDIAPGPGDDKVSGGGNSATGFPNFGGDTIDFFDSEAGVTVDLAAGTATGDGNDTFSGMEDVYGSDFNDSIAGDQNVDNYIDGAAGLDWIDYSAYSRDLTVSLGNLNPTVDNDPTDDANECDGKSGECDALVHIENAILGTGDDSFKGSEFNNVVNPGGGQNVLDGLGGGDTLDYSSYDAGVTVNLAGGGVSGDSAVSFENVVGSNFKDRITGGVESNTIRSGKGDDNVRAGAGDDTLRLGAGDDIARGGSGDDDLYGQKGDDYLNGGSGTDFCKGGPGKDTVKGCEIH